MRIVLMCMCRSNHATTSTNESDTIMTTKQAKRTSATTKQSTTTKHSAATTTASNVSAASVLRELGIHNAKTARSLLRSHNIARDDRNAIIGFYAERGLESAKKLMGGKKPATKRTKR